MYSRVCSATLLSVMVFGCSVRDNADVISQFALSAPYGIIRLWICIYFKNRRTPPLCPLILSSFHRLCKIHWKYWSGSCQVCRTCTVHILYTMYMYMYVQYPQKLSAWKGPDQYRTGPDRTGPDQDRTGPDRTRTGPDRTRTGPDQDRTRTGPDFVVWSPVLSGGTDRNGPLISVDLSLLAELYFSLVDTFQA